MQAGIEYATLTLGRNVILYEPSNIYRCTIGDGSRVGPFCEIQRGVVIGSQCKIGSHTFICGGVTIGNRCFIGHGVMFCNDRWPRATYPAPGGHAMKMAEHWVCQGVAVGDDASIGTGAVILPGVVIGARAMVGAGTVVTRRVPDGHVAWGMPMQVRPIYPDDEKRGMPY